MPRGPLARLRRRRIGLLAALAGTNMTPDQLAAARTELEQIDQQLRDFGESGELVIEQTTEEMKLS